MQSAVTTLPELNLGRHDAQSAPKVRHRNLFLALEPLLRLRHPALQLGAAVVTTAVAASVLRRHQHGALPARPRAYAAAPRARVKVGLALLAREAGRHALDADLPLQGRPVEAQRGVRVGAEVGRLPRRAKVGVDDVAVGVELLEVHHAGGHPARWQLRRRQRARLGGRGARALPADGLLRLGKPLVELRDGRGAVEVGARERAQGELRSLSALCARTSRGDYLFKFSVAKASMDIIYTYR